MGDPLLLLDLLVRVGERSGVYPAPTSNGITRCQVGLVVDHHIGSLCSFVGFAAMPNLSDGNWHQCEFYVKFSTGVCQFWFDSVLRLNRAYGSGYWTGLYYISGPSEDASGGGGYQTFVRQVDDYLIYDGMP